MIYLIFSKDRPLQLELTLSTCKHFSVDWGKDIIVVLYKASNERYQKAYDNLEKNFQDVEFVKQYNFMSDVLNILSLTEYILFSVDDCVFTNYFSTEDIVSILKRYGSVGFSLRLGKNTTYCYPLRKNNDIPNFVSNEEDIISFWWRENKTGDFYYPLEVSSSIYRAKDILKVLDRNAFSNPNALESVMDSNKNILGHMPTLSCFETSVAFCNPINKVQNVNWNRAGTNPDYSVESLLEKYEQGYLIDEIPLYGYVSNGCHREVDLNFIK